MSDKSSKLLSGCKDTMAGKGAFSLFQFTHAISVYFSLLPIFFACKGTMRGNVGLGNSGTSREIKTLTGKWRTEEIEEAE
jgi:hypothetical protein